MSFRTGTNPRLPALVMGAWATVAAGCGGGALNQAIVAGECTPGTGSCEHAQLDGPLAVGATFTPKIEVELPGSTAPAMHVESARPEVLAIEGDHVVARAPGLAALLFVTDDGTVVDFLHVFSKAPTRIALDRIAPDGSSAPMSAGFDLITGETLRVRGAALGDGQPLAGTMPFEWSVTPADVVGLLADGSPDRRRILAKSPGTATVKVRGGGLETSLEVVVNAAPKGALAMEVSR